MFWFIIGIIIGLIVGWQVAEPPWAKWFYRKVKGWFVKAVDDTDGAGA